MKTILVYPTNETLNIVIDGKAYKKDMTAPDMVRLANELLTRASDMMYFEKWNEKNDS
jgi:hypothetical protein|tara:strand:+ start:2918 stop:3091 length:174 start_codon:yes stop_codon:yes gene_type:complete